MADLQQMSRILYHHNWTNIEDWARNVDQLADLSDDEIGQLQKCDGCCCPSDAPLPRVSSSPRRLSLIERTKLGLLSLCESLRYGSRRTC